MIETAVILAAGQGSRLRDAWSDLPKGFLRLGAAPIVEESIARLRQAGIQRIVIVTGFAADHYNSLAARLGAGVSTVHNPDFADSGSMYSLWCAREQVRGPFLLLESDLVYEPRALRVLLRHPGADAVLLSGPTGAGDEVWVEARDGRLGGMSKNRADLAGEPAGELVGISKLSTGLYDLMLRLAEREFTRSLHVSYETDTLVAAARQMAVDCLLVPELCWGEIDDPAHLYRVRQLVYPRVAALDRGVRAGDDTDGL